MKIGGKRIARGNLLLILGMVTVSVCTLLMSSALRANRLNDMKNREFYSSQARKFQISNCEEDTLWQNTFQECPPGFVLYHQVIDNEMDIRAVYTKGDLEAPEMIWGRFFEETDQFQGWPTVVVGKAYEERIIYEGEQAYFDYGGERFLVLGVMGCPWESRIDSQIYLDFASGLSLTSSNGQYILDGNSDTVLDGCIQVIEKEVRKYGRMGVSVQDNPQTFTQKYLKGGFGMIMYMLIYLSFFLSVVIMANMWMGYRSRTVSILQMLGLTGTEVFRELGRSFLYLSLIGWAVGNGLAVLAAMAFQVIEFRWIDFVISFGATIVTGLAALSIPFIKRIGMELAMGMR